MGGSHNMVYCSVFKRTSDTEWTCYHCYEHYAYFTPNNQHSLIFKSI